MKTKNLTFMEAVEQMKLGKKVRRKSWKQGRIIHREGYDLSSNIKTNDKDIIYDNLYVSIDDIEATDWEVVDDDKNWDWNEEFNLIIHKLQRHLTPEQLAPIVNQLLGIHDKLRDLILKHSDYADCLGNEQVVPVSKIKEIFGDLK